MARIARAQIHFVVESMLICCCRFRRILPCLLLRFYFMENRPMKRFDNRLRRLAAAQSRQDGEVDSSPVLEATPRPPPARSRSMFVDRAWGRSSKPLAALLPARPQARALAPAGQLFHTGSGARVVVSFLSALQTPCLLAEPPPARSDGPSLAPAQSPTTWCVSVSMIKKRKCHSRRGHIRVPFIRSSRPCSPPHLTHTSR